MADRMVHLKNTMNATLSVRKPQYGVNRTWAKRGQVQALPFDTVEQLLWDTGFSNMIKSGMLYIDSMKDKIDLGLEPEGATKPVNIIAVDEQSVAEIWNTMDMEEFKKTVSRLTRTQIDNIISYAVETKNINLDKVNFIKEITADSTGKNGRDILKILEHKKQVEEGKKLAERPYDEVN